MDSKQKIKSDALTEDKNLDAYVAALIAEESAQAHKRYQDEGIDAYLKPKRYFRLSILSHFKATLLTILNGTVC